MSNPTMTVTQDNTEEIMKLIKSFKNDKVLVGIPAEDPTRTAAPGEESSGINNATLLFINNFGSPVNNIPPRPVMDIGISLAQEPIAGEYRKALQGAWAKGLPYLNTYYNRIGIIASNSVKKVINEQIDVQPPALSTIAGRKRKGFSGSKALIVTGQMRNAITYVVQDGK